MILEIKKFDEPILNKQLNNVINIDEETLKELDDMLETLHEYGNGVGLCANQVGIDKNMFIIELDAPIYVINPKIIEMSPETVLNWEGCLSDPVIDYIGLVERHLQIKVTYLNKSGETINETLTGLPSIVFQHEFDHTMGINYVARARNKKRYSYRRAAEYTEDYLDTVDEEAGFFKDKQNIPFLK